MDAASKFRMWATPRLCASKAAPKCLHLEAEPTLIVAVWTWRFGQDREIGASDAYGRLPTED